MKKKYYIGRQASLSFAGSRSKTRKSPLLACLGLLLTAGFSYLLLLTNQTQPFTTLSLIYAGITFISGSMGGYFAIQSVKARIAKMMMLLICLLSFILGSIGLLYFISFMSKTF